MATSNAQTVKAQPIEVKPYKQDGPVYVRAQKGVFQRLRRYMGSLFMLVFLATPFIQYDGHQAILLDVAEQKFHLFGTTLFPQDLTLLAFLFIVGAFVLFFITTWLGRVWCGFMCPQTIWTLSYIWVEEKIEGNRNQRIKLDKAPLSATKIRKKSTKHSIWLAMSFLTATSFMAYFIPVRELYPSLISLEWSGLIWFWVGFFTLCTYGNAGFLREKMCVYMCPYSRFQSAMFDGDTLIVSYDAARGEGRGKRKRNEDHKAKGLGDCVDCNLCVQVCPTGIDIRNGLQYECISCASCVDACDQTMEKFGYDKGLIRFTSENSLAGNKTKIFRPKILGYGFASCLIVVALLATFHARVPLEVSVLRDRNALYRVNYMEQVENSYRFNITNKTQQALSYRVNISGVDQLTSTLAQELIVPAGEMVTVPVTVTIDPSQLSEQQTDLTLSVEAITQPDIQMKKVIRFFTKPGLAFKPADDNQQAG